MAYTADFYASIGAGSRISAKEVIPELLALIGPVESVLDVGCGTGTWLAEFADRGITDYVGIDGSYVDQSQLCIPPEQFAPRDLTKALELDRTFDLVYSLEVAEHLEERYAAAFVKSLCDHASEAIMFSAAIPGQGNERAQHVNEQWPSYWVSKFAEHGFVLADTLRPRIWNNTKVESWYRQNTLLFARGTMQDRLNKADVVRLLDVVHPAEFARHCLTPSEALRAFMRKSLPEPVVSALLRARQRHS